MASPTNSELQALLPSLTALERVALDLLLDPTSPWQPLDGPQLAAFTSEADITFYGGQAGGGKTDLLCGLAKTAHRKSIIFRREYPQLRGIIERLEEIQGGREGFNEQKGIWRLGDGRVLELGAVQRERDKEKYQGRPHDLKAFDEICHFTETQFRFLTGWTRTSVPGQHCRVVCVGNPPLAPEEEWVIRFFAPWLDPEHPNPAKPGELRWFVVLDGKDVEVEGPALVHHGDEAIKPRSRTFIPASVDDNPFLMATGYKATLQGLPEPLRTALLKGIFGRWGEDDRWQVIPSAWVDAAMARWTEEPPKDARGSTLPIDAVGADIARGGDDKTVFAPRRGRWFAPLVKLAGAETPDGPTAAAAAHQVALGAPIHIDIIGVGGSAFDCLVTNNLPVVPMVASATSHLTDRSGRLGFANKRAEWYWTMRELLDPDHGVGLMLPPDRELKADLCAPRWKLTHRGILVEPKEDIIKRLGRSPDCADAAVYAVALPDQEQEGVVVYHDPVNVSSI